MNNSEYIAVLVMFFYVFAKKEKHTHSHSWISHNLILSQCLMRTELSHVTCHRAYLRDSPAEFRESDSFCGEELYGGWDGDIQIMPVDPKIFKDSKVKKTKI